MNVWTSIPARSLGFTYFNTYVNQSNGLVLGWVAKSTIGPYLVYFFDRNVLAGLVSTTRGTAQHARWAVQGAIEDQNFTEGIHQSDIPQITVQIIKHQEIQQLRGW